MNRGGVQFPELLTAARAGDRAALGVLLDSFRSYLNLLAGRKLGADLKAKCSRSDLVQRTFLDAQAAFDRFAGCRQEEMVAWLERILLNNVTDVARHYRETEKRRIEREVPLAGNEAEIDRLIDRSTPSKKVAALEEGERLQQALARLPDDYREVIVLRNLQRHTFEDIARVMGRSAGAVRKLWGRAILELKDEMKTRRR